MKDPQSHILWGPTRAICSPFSIQDQGLPKADVHHPYSGPGPAITWARIAVIVASGLYIIHRERIVARSRRASAATAEPLH
jgi:hypothetical protein